MKVDFKNMTKKELVQKAIDLELELCQEDTTYNDNTLFDLLMYGSKGFENMTTKELKQKITQALEWSEDEDEE